MLQAETGGEPRKQAPLRRALRQPSGQRFPSVVQGGFDDLAPIAAFGDEKLDAAMRGVAEGLCNERLFVQRVA